jgi:type II secretory pathway component PulF
MDKNRTTINDIKPVSQTKIITSNNIYPTPRATTAQSSEEIRSDALNQAAENKSRRTHKKLFSGMSRETSEYVMDSLSMLIMSGVSVGEAIESISQELPNKKVQKTILAMRTRIDEGVPFAKAMDETGLFGPSVITLVDVGQSTGKLADNLRVISEQMHKNNVMNAKIKSAMLYPAFLISLLFIVGTGIGVFLLPRLLTIIQSLQVKIGLTTKLLIVMGTFFGHYGLVGAGIVIVLVTLIGISIKMSPNVKAAAEAVLYKIPGIKKLLFETEVSRFGFVLGTLLEAGLPVVTALESLTGSMSTRRYQRFTNDLRTQIEEGNSFGKVLLDPKVKALLSGTICQIIVSAEKSGNLSSSLLKIGSNYEDKADITAHNLETLLEPIVLIIIAVGVLFVALAVFLPIYSLIGNLNGAK